MVVDREREIAAFVPQEYWTIDAKLAKPSDSAATLFARLVGLAGKRKKLEIGSAEESEHRSCAPASTARYRVASDAKKRRSTSVRRHPSRRAASSRRRRAASGFTAKRTMAVAQQLYEGAFRRRRPGRTHHVHAHRLDPRRRERPRRDTRLHCRVSTAPSLVPPAPRVFRKKAKGAQEAHEAIRPTSARREPASLKTSLNRDQMRLYTLIWQRMVASQMADAVYDQTTVDVEAQPKGDSERYLFRAGRSVLRFPGFARSITTRRTKVKIPKRSVPCRRSSKAKSYGYWICCRSSTSRSRRLASRKRHWSRRWRKTASAGPALTRPPYRRSRTAATSKRTAGP